MQQLSSAFPSTSAVGTLAGVGNTTLGMLKQSINYVTGEDSENLSLLQSNLAYLTTLYEAT